LTLCLIYKRTFWGGVEEEYWAWEIEFLAGGRRAGWEWGRGEGGWEGERRKGEEGPEEGEGCEEIAWKFDPLVEFCLDVGGAA
jgi:hypothetical protein